MKAAKKKNGVDPRRRTVQMMRRLLVEFRGRLDEELRPYGLTTSLMKLLWAIQQVPGSSGAQLSRMCEVTPQSAQSLIQKAEADGWIVRGKDRENDRILTASLTPAGEEMLATASEVVQGIEAKLWRGIPKETVVELGGVLERCLANIAE
jgi:DNA-binding MarR family transcriptional regulator